MGGPGGFRGENGEGESIFDPFRIPPFKERERERDGSVSGWVGRSLCGCREKEHHGHATMVWRTHATNDLKLLIIKLYCGLQFTFGRKYEYRRMG